jgi:hypothetical protein
MATKRHVKEFEVNPDAHVPVGSPYIPLRPGQANAVADWFRHETIGCSFCPWAICGRHSDEGRFSHRRNAALLKSFAASGKGTRVLWSDGGSVVSLLAMIHLTSFRRCDGQTQVGLAGRMGGKQQSILNLVVIWVESDLGLIFVKGKVPGTGGSRGAVVFARDAVKS